MVWVRAVLGESSIWQTEFASFSIIAATFLGAPYILLTRGHVNVDIVPLYVGPPTRRFLSLAGNVVALAFCLIFLYAAVPWWYEVFSNDQTTPSIWRARLWIPYLAVPVGLGLLSLQFIVEIWQVLARIEWPFGLSPGDRP
ncbi:MAG: TRAP transporter small permease [Burkholderiaceae bacterium]|nr:TRAP transporter small permease [Burkholderiaceae bacterium]